LRRILWMIPTLLGITLLVFVAVHAAPGDPAARAVGAEGLDPGASLEDRRSAFRAEHLLDQPLWKQYLHFLGPFDLSSSGHPWFGGSGQHPWHGVLVLDFGNELQRPDVAVLGEIGARLSVTVPLALSSVLFTYLIAVPLGVLAAVKRGSLLDRAGGGFLFLL